MDFSKDYYKILGVPRTASASEIREAYLVLIKKFHPDRNPENSKALAAFQSIVEAYNVLGDLDNRLMYSIYLNRDILERELKNKKFDIPGFKVKKVKRKKQPE